MFTIKGSLLLMLSPFTLSSIRLSCICLVDISRYKSKIMVVSRWLLLGMITMKIIIIKDHRKGV